MLSIKGAEKTNLTCNKDNNNILWKKIIGIPIPYSNCLSSSMKLVYLFTFKYSGEKSREYHISEKN